MSAGEYAAVAAELLARIRARRPLVHHVTNLVVMNDTANVTLQLGASPVMAHAREEAADMAAVADALLLNQGTLEPAWVEAMLLAGRRAAERGIPVVLDPVGAGATPYRTGTAHRLLEELTLAVGSTSWRVMRRRKCCARGWLRGAVMPRRRRWPCWPPSRPPTGR